MKDNNNLPYKYASEVPDTPPLITRLEQLQFLEINTDNNKDSAAHLAKTYLRKQPAMLNEETEARVKEAMEARGFDVTIESNHIRFSTPKRLHNCVSIWHNADGRES